MLMGTGGNCGSQSSTLMIRGLAVGEIEFKDIFKVIFKEIRVALIVGALLAVVNGIRQLAELGLVTHAPYKSAELTPAGIERALQVLHRHKMLTTFLEFLGVSPDVAEADACRMEHFLSQETCDAISRHLEEHHISLEPPHESHSQKR